MPCCWNDAGDELVGREQQLDSSQVEPTEKDTQIRVSWPPVQQYPSGTVSDADVFSHNTNNDNILLGHHK